MHSTAVAKIYWLTCTCLGAARGRGSRRRRRG
jgi:hypothetical protein